MQEPSAVITPPASEPATEEPRVLSFAELKELIEQGKTDQIPNNRVIPNELSVRISLGALILRSDMEGTQKEIPSVSTAPARKKPWET